ncbi:Polyprenyl synthetase [gamma proteobacterium HdN1]|nr:Polyprenyl synthetase [gamma proteobacterium HdN1]
MTFDLHAYLQTAQFRVNTRLEYWFAKQNTTAAKLSEAMHYAVMNGGKRLRPVLAFAAAEACGTDASLANDAACALEMLHSYSLVHDDLPAMDNDALRRGVPTCHIAFDEATAILAGDALQCLAFEVLASSELPSMTTPIKLEMIRSLAVASGTHGMAGGQALDLAASGKLLDLHGLETIHRLKTGCLIRAAVRLGALAAHAPESSLLALDQYASALGLAYQVQDDILDVTGDTLTLGKQQGADAVLDKATYPRILGLQAAQALATHLHDQALQAIQGFGDGATPLRALASYIVNRRY